MDFKFHRSRLDKISEQKILEELEKAAKHFNYVEFAWRDFNKIADLSATTVKKHFGNWKNGLIALKQYLQAKGLDLSPRPFAPNRLYSDKALFDEMEKVWFKVGQRPSRAEWEMSNPQFSYTTYKQRFGSWTNACSKFIEYKMGADISADDFVLPDRAEQKISCENKITYKPENVRNVPLGLRLKVLNRDNFRCIFCGKSPATDLGTKLHIDHITPFSKGGGSIIENLQTLCQECNLGKSNHNIGRKKDL